MSMRPALVVVDDDKIYHFLISRLLDVMDFPVPDVSISKFFSGKEVLQYFSEDANASKIILLLDLNMPILSGFDVLDALQSMEGLDHRLSIYIVTSSVNSDDREKAEEYSMVKDFLVKPLNREDLQNLINLEFGNSK